WIVRTRSLPESPKRDGRVGPASAAGASLFIRGSVMRRNPDWCPLPHFVIRRGQPLARTSQAKGRSQAYGSVPLFDSAFRHELAAGAAGNPKQGGQFGGEAEKQEKAPPKRRGENKGGKNQSSPRFPPPPRRGRGHQ